MAKNNIKILFWLAKARVNKKGQASIYLRVTYNYERKALATGHFIEPQRWDADKIRVKGTQEDAQIINTYILQTTNKLNALFQEMLQAGEIDLDKLIDKFMGRDNTQMTLLELVKYHNEDFKKRVGLDYTASTYQKYEILEKKLKTFIPFKYGKKDVKLRELNRIFATDFDYYLKSEDKNQHNTVVKYINNLKKIINMAVANDWLDKSPFMHVKAVFKESNKIVLTMPELMLLKAKQFKIERLNIVRDLFLFQCFTGLAFADMAKLKGKDVTTGIDGNKWIITNRRKTDTRSAIPLLPQALEVIEKYNAFFAEKQEEKLLPLYSNQKYNSYLQEIAELCGINKVITSHVGRRTFATTVALSNGVSIETISKILGHTNTKITQQYAQVTDLKISEEMAFLVSQIGK